MVRRISFYFAMVVILTAGIVFGYGDFMSKKNNYNEIQYVQKDQNYNSSEVWILCSYLVLKTIIYQTCFKTL